MYGLCAEKQSIWETDKYTSVGLQSYTEKKRIICFAGFTDDCPFTTPKPLFILLFLMQCLVDNKIIILETLQ